MENALTDKPVPTNVYPHNGQLFKNFILKNHLNRAQIARQMNISNVTVHKYDHSSSLQLRILWNASLVLKHNFVAELGDLLPVDFVTLKEASLQSQLDTKQIEIGEMQRQIDDLNLQISVYKSIVEK